MKQGLATAQKLQLSEAKDLDEIPSRSPPTTAPKLQVPSRLKSAIFDHRYISEIAQGT